MVEWRAAAVTGKRASWNSLQSRPKATGGGRPEPLEKEVQSQVLGQSEKREGPGVPSVLVASPPTLKRISDPH
jgi:hypothetical protein